MKSAQFFFILSSLTPLLASIPSPCGYQAHSARGTSLHFHFFPRHVFSGGQEYDKRSEI